jgi:hypothetical protein
MNSILESACNGKSFSQGGLNVPELKKELTKLLPEKASAIQKANRAGLHEICQKHLLAKPQQGLPQNQQQGSIKKKKIISIKKKKSIIGPFETKKYISEFVNYPAPELYKSLKPSKYIYKIPSPVKQPKKIINNIDYEQLSKLGIPPACGAKNFSDYIRNYKNLLLKDANVGDLEPEEIFDMLITRQGSEEDVVLENLIDNASAYGINIHQDRDKIVTDLSKLMPCEWISLSRNPMNPHEYLDRYVTDEWMGIKQYIKEGTEIFGHMPNESDLVSIVNNINYEIYQQPRTTEQFSVFKGFELKTGLNVGDIIEMNIPTSGTFSIDQSLEYVYYDNAPYTNYELPPQANNPDKSCCLTEIIIPANMPLSYHPSENQVIFPVGSRYKIISQLPSKKSREFEIGTYKLLYIYAPKQPIKYNSFSDIPSNKLSILSE